MLLEVLEHGPVPAGPIRAGAEIRGAGGDQLDAGVGPLHQLGGFQGELAVVLGAAVAHLPGTVHLVAQPPVGDFPGIARGRSACAAGSWRCLRRNCSTPPTAGPRPRAGAEVGADVGLGSQASRRNSGTRGCRSDCFPPCPTPFPAAAGAGRADRCRRASDNWTRSCRPASAAALHRASWPHPEHRGGNRRHPTGAISHRRRRHRCSGPGAR